MHGPGRRDSHDGEPVRGRVHDRRVALGRCGDYCDVHPLARSARDACGIEQPVAAYENLIGRFRQIWQDVAPLVVGDHDAHESCRQVAGLGDDPYARFRSLLTGHDAGNIVTVDRDRAGRPLLCMGADERAGERAGQGEVSDRSGQAQAHNVSLCGPLITCERRGALRRDTV